MSNIGHGNEDSKRSAVRDARAEITAFITQWSMLGADRVAQCVGPLGQTLTLRLSDLARVLMNP